MKYNSTRSSCRRLSLAILAGFALSPVTPVAAQLLTEIGFPSLLFPPLTGVHTCDQTLSFPQGAVNPVVQLRDLRLRPPATSQAPPAAGSPPVTQTFTTKASAWISSPTGFQPVEMDATVTIQVSASTDPLFFDTEMLQLDLTGTGPLGPFLIRESPTLPSLGSLKLRESPTLPSLSHAHQIDSFFDIFTELSLNGGQTWSAATDSGRATLSAPSAENSFHTPNLPPLSSVHRAAGPVNFPNGNGVIIRNLAVRNPTQSIPPPPPGGTQIHLASATVTCEMSANGGASYLSYVAPCDFTQRVTSLLDDGDVRYFDTEMLQLDIAGGNLPAGVMIRESPTRASAGRTSSRQGVDNRYRISSFFDIFTELSVDGGQNWSPTTNGPCVLAFIRESPTRFFTNTCFPLPGEYASPDDDSATFGTTGVVIRRFRESPTRPSRDRLPGAGTSETRSIPCGFSLEVSLDGGKTYQHHHVATLKDVMIISLATGGSGSDDCPMESISFNLALPGGVMVRESPSKASLGRTTTRTAVGGHMISSFFDIWTEISLDSGQNWTPSDQVLHCTILPYLEAENIFAHTFMPPRDGSLEMRRFERPVSCSNGVHIRKLSLGSFSRSRPLPATVCDPETQDFSCDVTCELSIDDGLSWQPVSTTATGSMSASRVGSGEQSSPSFFDTEMLALDLSSASLPQGVRIRESPTRASTGRIRTGQCDDGSYRIDSFFDIFYEISVDGGSNWTPAANPAPLAQRAPAPMCFSRSDWLPPALEMRTPNNQLVCWGGDVGVGGLKIRNNPLLTQIPMPALGAASVVSFTAPVELDLTLDGGTTTSRVGCDASLSCTFSDVLLSSLTSLSNECTQFDLTGGTLPAGVRLRESPTRASLGRTTVRLTDGGHRISSFFDIFTEVSIDGGQSWTPVCSPLHVECGETPGGLLSSSGTQLPPSRWVSPPGAISARCASGKHISHAVLTLRKSAPPVQLPSPGHTTLAFDTCDVEFLYSADDGDTFTPVRAQAFYRYEMENVMISGYSFFDTEMVQLEFYGGTMPPGVMIRESPSKASLGVIEHTETTIGSDKFQIASFFDIFTEISLDSGRTWEPFDIPVSYQFESLIDSTLVASPTWPPPGHQQRITGDPDFDLLFTNGARASFFDIFTEVSGPALPPPGSTTVHNGQGTCSLRLALSGGPPIDVHGNVIFAAQFAHAGSDADGRSFFDTEMLQLDLTNLTGGTLPAGVRLRESPSRPSKGHTTLRAAAAGGGGGAGGFMIDSFFDIFTEISLDDGQTWSECDAPLRLAVLNPEIHVSTPDGDAIADGGTVTVNATITSTVSIQVAELRIRNDGSGDLTGLEVSFDGPDATSFSVITPPVGPVPPGGSTTCKIGFASSSPGTRMAVLHLSTNDPDESPFDISFVAVALMPDADADSDGVSNSDELALRDCGLDPLVHSGAAIQRLRDSGFFLASDMHALALGSPVLERDPTTSHFNLRLRLRKSPDLLNWTPLTGFAPTFSPAAGVIDLDITPDESNIQFYRVLGGVPAP